MKFAVQNGKFVAVQKIGVGRAVKLNQQCRKLKLEVKKSEKWARKRRETGSKLLKGA